jgi:PST family polysaccharide transporter
MALSVALAITLAAFHAGVWALVWSAVAYQVLTMISWHLATGWRPNTFPSFASLRLVSTFAGWYTAAALSWYLVTNADNFLVAKLLGLSGLGYYILAYNLASVPVMLVASPFGQVIIPRLAALHGDHDAFWDLYERSSRFMTTVATPICAGMAVAAPDLVVGLFGPKWSPSVAPLQVLLAYMAVRLLVVDPYAALGRFGASFAVGVGALLLEIAAILVLVSLWGLTGAALGVLVIVGGAHLAGLPICGASRTLGRRLWRSFPLIIATVSVVAIGIAVSNLTIRNAPQVAGHVPLAAITGIVVLALMLYVSRSYLTTVWSDLRGPGA